MNNILFICIGNSNIIGDSLGPLVGSFFQSYKNNLLNYYNIEIQGTMENPVGYKKINEILENIENKEYTKIIIIDSALGDEKNIGKILFNSSYLYAGSGVNYGKKLMGDIVIRGIVGKNHNNTKENIKELTNVNINIVEETALKTITTIIPILTV